MNFIKPHLSSESLRRYRDSIFPPLGGPIPAPGKTSKIKDCMGRTVTMKYGPHGERNYTGYNSDKVEVILVGDSYTYGLELEDSDTPAAIMSREGNIMTANLGRPGYDPLRSYILAQHWRSFYPSARVVIMGIMYENINRLATSYWPVYENLGQQQLFSFEARAFSFKPYMRNGEIFLLNKSIFRSKDTFLDAARKAVKEDYWSRPIPNFPYTLSLIKAMTSHAFRDGILMHWGALNKQMFRSQYENPELSKNLLVILSRYAKWAKEADIIPVVFFIPLNGSDTTSPDIWIKQNSPQLPDNLIIKNMDFSNVDQSKYNLKPDGSCHPSPYGARQIGQQYIHLIRSIPANN